MTGPTDRLRGQVAQRAASDSTPAVRGEGEQAPTIYQMIDRQRSEIARALPKHMNPDRLARVITTVIRQTPALLECTQASLLGAAMLSAQTGLEPGPLGHCYWLPFYNRNAEWVDGSGRKRTGANEVTWIMGYKGILDLARRSGQLLSIEARAVYADDDFDFEYGLEEKLIHRPSRKERPEGADPEWFYMIARFKDGGRYFRVMSKAEVDAHRARSKASSRGPWVTDYEAMGCKTTIRAAAPWLPLSIEVSQALVADDDVHRGVVNLGDIGYNVPAEPPAIPTGTGGGLATDGVVVDQATGEVSGGDPSADDAGTSKSSGPDAPAEEAPVVEDPPTIDGGDWPETTPPGSKRSR